MAHRFCPKPGTHAPHTLRYRGTTLTTTDTNPWSGVYELPPVMTAVCDGKREEDT